MVKYRIRSENGPESPNFKTITDFKKWLIDNYGNRVQSFPVFKYDGPKYGWIMWGMFRTEKVGNEYKWAYTNENRSTSYLTASGRSKR